MEQKCFSEQTATYTDKFLNFIGYGMGSLAPASNEHPRRDWTLVMDQYFIELMLDQLGKGNKISNSFTEQAWNVMVTLFNSKFCTQHGKRFLKRRYKKLEKYYSDLKTLLEQNGFSWDDRQQMVAANDDVWDNYIKVCIFFKFDMIIHFYNILY